MTSPVRSLVRKPTSLSLKPDSPEYWRVDIMNTIRKKLIFLLVYCFLFSSLFPLTVNSANIDKQLVDDLDDVYRISHKTNQASYQTDNRPWIDIEYIKFTSNGGRNATISLKIHDNATIKNRDDSILFDAYNITNPPGYVTFYEIQIETKTNNYHIKYINKTCIFTGGQYLQHVVNGSFLNISFLLKSAHETFQSMTALSYEIEIDENKTISYFSDYIPNDQIFTISINPSKNCSGRGETIQFTAKLEDRVGITTEPYTYQWDLGNTCHKQSKCINHTFYDSGRYAIVVTATDRFNISTSTRMMFTVTKEDCLCPTVTIQHPQSGLYIKNLGWGRHVFEQTLIFGTITVRANPFDNISGIERVEFYLDGEKQSYDETIPYEWKWNERNFLPLKMKIRVIAYDFYNNKATDSIIVTRFW